MSGRLVQAFFIAAVACLVLGPLAARLGVVAPLRGFGLMGLGGVLSLCAMVSGIVARRGHLGGAWAAAGIALGGAVLIAAIASFAMRPRAPRINDVTTNPSDPPELAHAAKAPQNEGRDMSYPADNAQVQKDAYPDLKPVELNAPPPLAIARARRVARDMGWEVIAENREGGRLEARDESALFRFVDDIAVRARPTATGSVVDVRSKSRDGKGDLGVNAKRIREFVTRLQNTPDGALPPIEP